MTEQELWKERATAAGTALTECRDWDAVAARVAQLCASRPDRADLISGRAAGHLTVAVPGLPPSFRQSLKKLLPADAELLESGLRAYAGGLDVGVVMARAAVADTGSCLVDGTDEDVRLATMLPDASVLVLPEDAILPDLAAADALVAELLDGDAPRHLTFITGPSRTADIERVLTLGVHGPLTLDVLLVPPAIMQG